MKRLMSCLLGMMLCATAAAWETKAFRTESGGLIVPGMTKAQVRREAGKPLEDAAHPKRGKSRKRGADDIWTYRGSDGVYQLTFLRGKVYRIDVTPDREF